MAYPSNNPFGGLNFFAMSKDGIRRAISNNAIALFGLPKENNSIHVTDDHCTFMNGKSKEI